MRILITEEALQSGEGHWLGYIGGIARGLRAAGDQIDVLVHRKATQRVQDQTGGTPWFSRNCWIDQRSQGALGGIIHNLTFRKELASWLEKAESYDWICNLTMRTQHLLAFALLAGSNRIPKDTRYLLLFVQGFGTYAGPGQPSTFPPSLSSRFARICFKLLASSVRSGRVVLAAETKGMQEELKRFTGLTVSLFPHPVSPPQQESIGSTQGTGVGEQDGEAGSQDQGTENREPITITCPGFARHEKGSDLMLETIRCILASPDGDDFRFVMQWPEPFAMPDGSIREPYPELIADHRVEFLNQSLDAEAYESLLSRTKLVILPYRCSSYHHRVSRVAIEAASRGIPLIYTAGTWTEEIAEITSCGVAIREESADAIEDALRTAVREYPTLARLACESALKVAMHHSAEKFRTLLVERT